MNLNLKVYVLSCLLAATAPLTSMSGIFTSSSNGASLIDFPGWPTEFEGNPLTSVPMLQREQRFYRDFDGKIARFTDGEKQIIIRWTTSSSRQFHLTTRCFRAIGYTLTPLPAYTDQQGKMWGAFQARRHNETLEVHEIIEDSQGRTWTDESSWRWDTFWKQTSAPWWAYTVAQAKH